MPTRQLPRPRDFADLLKFRAPVLNPTTRQLAHAHTISDLRQIAKRVIPKAPFDYTDGAGEAELSLARARQAFRDIEFHPAILRDVSDIDTSCSVVGGRSALPFGIAPTGFHADDAYRRRAGGCRGSRELLGITSLHELEPAAHHPTAPAPNAIPLAAVGIA